MNFQNIQFPAVIIILIAFLSPLLISQGTATLIIWCASAALILGFVGVAAYNTYQDNRKNK